MKTQKTHLERQIIHSQEVQRHRQRVKDQLTQKRMYIGSWLACGLWVVWVGAIFLGLA